MTRHAVAVVLVSAALLARVDAITIVPMTFEELANESAAIVYARVADVEGRWSADRGSIESRITLEALRYFKGDLGERVLVRLPGGEAGGMIQVLPGAPVLREGELVVLFLASRGPSIPTTVGLAQGVFRVARDPRSGAMLVSPPPLKASAAGRVVRGAADRRSLTLDAFDAAVRELGSAR